MTCCMNNECEKHSTCKRHMANGAEINFKSICGAVFDYKWYIEDDTKLPATKEEGEVNAV